MDNLMLLNTGREMPSLNAREKNLVLDGFTANALSNFWDRMTENANYPDNCSLSEAKEVVNSFLIESEFDGKHLRK
jgi:hypothetical protein